MSGRWEGPDDFDALLDVYHQAHVGIPMAEFLVILTGSGLLTRKAYYVPDADELMGLMRRFTYGLPPDLRDRWRWVMCRETVDALACKYDRKVAPKPVRFDASWWADSDLPSAALELEVNLIIESQRYWSGKDRLFGHDIRIDPAARRPMFEIDEEPAKPRPMTPSTEEGS